MKLLPDTNILVYDTIEDSGRHDEAAKIIDSASEILISPIVIHEYIWVMLRLNISPKIISVKVHEYLEDIRARYINESLKVINDALKMFEEDKALLRDINDYIILSLALNTRAVLATFDRGLKTLSLSRGLSVIP